jgi:hypothetical protein
MSTTNPDYDQPETAPETTTSADGTAVLRRFDVIAVIYAPDEASARSRVEGAAVYFDRARLVGEQAPRGHRHRQAEPAQS